MLSSNSTKLWMRSARSHQGRHRLCLSASICVCECLSQRERECVRLCLSVCVCSVVRCSVVWVLVWLCVCEAHQCTKLPVCVCVCVCVKRQGACWLIESKGSGMFSTHNDHSVCWRCNNILPHAHKHINTWIHSHTLINAHTDTQTYPAPTHPFYRSLLQADLIKVSVIIIHFAN